MKIEWKRVAKPQPDGYDSEVIASILNEKYGWKKIQPTSELRLCNGAVAVVQDRQYTPEQISHPSNPMTDGMPYMTPEVCAGIDRFLMAWPEGGQMLQLFLDEYWAKWSKFMDKHGRGCSSGHYEMKSCLHDYGLTKGLVLNAVYVTANDWQGCSEGIYHEVGHARLESVGIDIDTHDSRLLLNGPDELYDSPVRWDIKRPMSAVVQAVYSWIMFCEADIQCAKNLTGYDTKHPEQQQTAAEASVSYLIGNIPKIQDGLTEIRNNIKFTPEGKDFFDGYLEWGEDVVARGIEVLKDGLGNQFETRYAQALEYREERLRVLEETAKKLQLDPNYSHGVEQSTKEVLLAELKRRKDEEIAAEPIADGAAAVRFDSVVPFTVVDPSQQ
jgi:hypothetical protein